MDENFPTAYFPLDRERIFGTNFVLRLFDKSGSEFVLYTSSADVETGARRN